MVFFNLKGLMFRLEPAVLCLWPLAVDQQHKSIAAAVSVLRVVVQKLSYSTPLQRMANWFALVAAWPLVEEYLTIHPVCNSTQHIVGALRRRKAASGCGGSWQILACIFRLSRSYRFLSWCSSCLRSPCPGCCGLMTPLFKGCGGTGTPFHEWNAVFRSGTSAKRRLNCGGALCGDA